MTIWCRTALPPRLELEVDAIFVGFDADTGVALSKCYGDVEEVHASGSRSGLWARRCSTPRRNGRTSASLATGRPRTSGSWGASWPSSPPARWPSFTGTRRANQTVELRDEIVTMGVEAFDCWYGMMELSSLAGCELLLAGSRSAAARADAEQRRRDPVVRVPGVRGHRQRHGHHPWERAAAVRKGVCSVDGASVSFKPSSC